MTNTTTHKQKETKMEQVLILDDFDRILGVLELKNWKHIKTLEKFFFDLVTDCTRWNQFFPSLANKRTNIDIHNKLEIDMNICFSDLSSDCVRIDIFGDDGVISLQLIPLNKVNKKRIK